MNGRTFVGGRCPQRVALSLAVAAVLCTGASASAAAKYWDTIDDASGLDAGSGAWNTGGTALWNTSSTGADPLATWANNDDAFFQTGGTNVLTLSGTIQVNSITLGSATNTTLNGGTLQLNATTVGIKGPGTTDASTLTINSAVVLGASQAWETTAASVTTVNGDITGAGNTLELKNGGANGQRPITFNGTNSLGAITVQGTGSTSRVLFLNGNTTLSGALSTTATTSGNAMIFSGADNSFGSVSLNIGTIALGGANTVASNVTVGGAGRLIIERDANVGASTAMTFGSAIVRVVGTGFSSFGGRTLTFNASSNLNLDIDEAGHTFTLNKVVAGGTGGRLAKHGKGTVVLTQANTYGNASNGTTVLGGVLQVDNQNGGSLNNAATLSVGGGTFLLTGKTGAVTTQGTGAVTVSSFGSTVKADGGTSTSTALNLGAITAATAGGSLNFVTTGTTTPTITTTSAVDATGIYGGRITYNGSDWATSAGAGPTYTLAAYSGYSALATSAGTDTANSLITSAGTTSLSGSRTTNTLKIANAGTGALDVVSGNTLTLTAGGLLYTGSTDYQLSNGTLKSNTATASDLIVHQNGTGELTIGSVIANGIATSTLTKTGAGTLKLSGANTFTGITSVNEGVLSVAVVSGTNNNLGAGGQGLNLNGGTLQYTGVTATKAGTILLGSAGGTFDVTQSGTTLTLSGSVGDHGTGAGSLTKKGAGTLSFTNTNPNNSFTGGLFIEAGTVQLGVATGLNSGLPNNVTFTSASTGTLRLNGFSVAVSGLNTNATPGTTFVENNHASTASTLTVNSTFASNYAGTIRNGAAATLSLVKTGANSLTLGGTNTYTGATSVAAGELYVNGSLASGSAVTVNRGALLGGSGVVGGSVAFAAGATLAPGNSPGILTIGTSATLQGDSVFAVEIFGAAAGNTSTDHDQLRLTGTAATTATLSSGLDYSILDIDLGSYVPSNLQEFVIVNNTSAVDSQVQGLFKLADSTVLVNNALFTVASTTFRINYNVDGGLDANSALNDVVLTVVVPEPTALFAAVGAFAFLAGRRRRA